MKKVNIGLIGLGTIGSGVVWALQNRALFLKRKTGVELYLKKICDKDITTPRPKIKVSDAMLTTDVNDILRDREISIVIELIGGIHPAKEYIIRALKAGKDVVTANKALLAQEGREIFKVATEHVRMVKFEGSVGGGIPIIKALREGLIANRISTLFGIINGTSNYILTEMARGGCEFKDALARAQAKGYAERDPSLDIKGIDSAHKIEILTLLGFGTSAKLNEIFTEGIQDISLNDIRFAEEMGYLIKPLAIVKDSADKIEVRVHPTLLPHDHILAKVSGVYNAIYICGDMVGEALFYGQGAGKKPTASAVISDIVDLVRTRREVSHCNIPHLWDAHCNKKILKMEDIETKYYIRFMVIDRPRVLAQIAGVLGKYNISIASVTQKGRSKAHIVPIVMMVHEAKESNLRRALQTINKLPVVKRKSVAIRVEE
jgi:homoserine dehydrogenase